MLKLKTISSPILITLITAIFSLTMFSAYLSGTLRGNINWFFLPAAKFGIPEQLIDKGITPLYTDNLNVGWDGQFYYYIASDLLGGPDTQKHMDADAYRYQRIGLPLTANLVSKILFQSWVSPSVYYFTYFGLILAATFMLALLFINIGASPWYALFWGLSYGVNLTLFNGLPDAAAEAYLILLLFAYYYRNWFFYSLFAVMTALSREAYILVPAALGVINFFNDYKKLGFYNLVKNQKLKYIMMVIPGVVFCIWQIYIRLHFHISPSDQAFGILAYPFTQLVYYLTQYSQTMYHAYITHNKSEFIAMFVQVSSLLTYAFLMVSYFIVLILCLTKWRKNRSFFGTSVLISISPVIILDLFFGKTVMFDYTGYLKAINLLLFLIPLLILGYKQKVPRFFLSMLVAVLIFTNFLLWERVNAEPFIPLVNIPNNIPKQLPCESAYQVKITKVLGLKKYNAFTSDFYRKLWHKPMFYSMSVNIVNNSHFLISTTQGAGSYHLSYHVLNPKTHKVISDGLRTPLEKSLRPGENVTQPLLLTLPPNYKSDTVVISLVQEGCSWLYMQNPKNGLWINAQK